MINLSSHTISMLYLKTGEYKIGVIPPFLDELKAAIIRWDPILLSSLRNGTAKKCFNSDKMFQSCTLFANKLYLCT